MLQSKRLLLSQAWSVLLLALPFLPAIPAMVDAQGKPAGPARELDQSRRSIEFAFDISLIIDAALGRGAWNALAAPERSAVLLAVEKLFREISGAEEASEAPVPRILRSEIKGDRAVLTALVEASLVRFHLTQRNGSWFIVEYEDVDHALPRFADAIRGALAPERARGPLLELADENAERRVEKLIAAEGETPELLLLKATVRQNRQSQEAFQELISRTKENAGSAPAPDPAIESLTQITARWPEFAPAQLMLGRYLLFPSLGNSAIDPLHKDTESAIRALERYARLVPYDPRPQGDLAAAYESLEQFDKAEAAQRQAIRLDPAHLPYQADLVALLLARENPIRARAAMAQLLRSAGDPDEGFDALGELYEFSEMVEEEIKPLEALLLAFPREIARSRSGLYLLAETQNALNKRAEAIRTAQRIVALDPPEPGDSEYLSGLYRRARRFPEALAAANQALKVDEKSAPAHFERACALAQLGRKREAIAALRRMIELSGETDFDADDPDLQPLAPLPEFKIMKERR
ncbi:MAG: tetratricopeptide repeat protein [Blastocatellia bacterium]|nr:tetratricopeptide repeat protein [Blastocatellia bacterium]